MKDNELTFSVGSYEYLQDEFKKQNLINAIKKLYLNKKRPHQIWKSIDNQRFSWVISTDSG